ncbi:MAG: LysR family transcriptional regulator [Candidatus Limiplasma sp.]|nr:LysR family transcriptional regulator [Candidatus Limiplasma sp.]
MQLEYFRLFHKVAALGSISHAAEASHISQSALSQQIQRLEQELGVKLLRRSNKGVVPTEAGLLLEKYAERFMSLEDNLLSDLADMQKGEASHTTLRIAASPVVGMYGLPCAMFQIKSAFAAVTFNLTTAPSRDVEDSVSQGDSDIGFIIGPPQGQGLIHKPVYSDPVCLVAGSGFDVKPSLTMDELQAYPLVVHSVRSSLYRQVAEYLRRIGRDFSQYRILFHLDTAESVKSSVLQNHGLAFLPYLAIKKELYLKQLKRIDLADFDLNYDVHIIHKPQKDLPELVYRIAMYLTRMGSDAFC